MRLRVGAIRPCRPRPLLRTRIMHFERRGLEDPGLRILVTIPISIRLPARCRTTAQRGDCRQPATPRLGVLAGIADGIRIGAMREVGQVEARLAMCDMGAVVARDEVVDPCREDGKVRGKDGEVRRYAVARQRGVSSAI